MRKKRELVLDKPKRERVSRPRKPTVLFLPNEEKVTEELRWWIERCNTSELVAICMSIGLYADRTMPRDMLKRMAIFGVQEGLETEFSYMRKAVQAYLDGNPLLAIDPRVCPRNCRAHPDFFVFHCFHTNKEKILKFLRDKQLRDIVEKAVSSSRQVVEAGVWR